MFPATVNYYGDVSLRKRLFHGEQIFFFSVKFFQHRGMYFLILSYWSFSTHMNAEIMGPDSHE